MQCMIEIPQGLCKKAHKIRIKSLDELATGSGYLKRRRALLRAQLTPSVVIKVLYQNRKNGKKKRLARDSSAQRRTIECIASILSQGKVVVLVDQPKMSQAIDAVTKGVLKMIGQSVGPNSMLDACDGVEVTHRGYATIYRMLKHQIGLIALGQSASILPIPHQLASYFAKGDEHKTTSIH